MTDLSTRLIHFGASLARCDWLPSNYAEDLPKTTPKSLIREIGEAHAVAKRYSQLVKEAADEIRRMEYIEIAARVAIKRNDAAGNAVLAEALMSNSAKTDTPENTSVSAGVGGEGSQNPSDNDVPRTDGPDTVKD